MTSLLPHTHVPDFPPERQHWDIFCQVIDNFGDIGVCWRLAQELAVRGAHVQLRVDDASALAWMSQQPCDGVTVMPYEAPYQGAPQLVIEAFGCEAPAAYLQALAHQALHDDPEHASLRPLLVNLEYLSAESYVERCHRLPSLIMAGPAKGLTRWFFYPGFTPRTGGLLRERHLATRQAVFDRAAWRTAHGIRAQDCAVSLFCYEPPALPQLLDQWAGANASAALPASAVRLLVTPGRATQAVRALPQHQLCQAIYLPPRTQAEFDEMLWACDLNLVRGEDSLVRALWAGQPFVWHIYPQEDNAHHAKLDAFLDWMGAPDSLRRFHHAWNGMTPPQTLPTITPQLLQEWQQCVWSAQEKLQNQHDLISQLQQFAAEKS